MRVHLVNPNTSAATTAMMLALAQESAPAGMTIHGVTARFGASLITNAGQLAEAAEAVMALRDEFTGDGVIVAAFGDPGADTLRERVSIPVIGIGEASLTAAAAHGRFSVATTTPDLEGSIRARVAALGLADKLASIRNTAGTPAEAMADPGRLEDALQDLVDRCIRDDGAKAIVIGGGPLSDAARVIARRTRVPIVEPVPAALAWMTARLGLGT